MQSRPCLKDRKKFGQLADPLLQGRYPRRCFNYLVAIIAMCLNEEATFRPLIGDIVVALEYLASQNQSLEPHNVGVRDAPQPPSSQEENNSLPKTSESIRATTSV